LNVGCGRLLILCHVKAPLRWKTIPHLIGAVGAMAGFQLVKARLDASYVASQHPVDYATGQTGFDASLVKGYYAHMDAAGTLPIYVQTQIIDFAFIIFLGGGAIVFGTLMDCAENLVSFVMLADPQGFPSWLALIYSSFAVTKFACIALGMLLILTSLIFGLISLIRRLLSR